MPVRHRNLVIFAGSFLLLSAALSINAGEGWNCVTGPGGSGWSCTGQDKNQPRNKVPPESKAPPAKTASQPAGAPTAAKPSSQASTPAKRALATTEQPRQTAREPKPAVSTPNKAPAPPRSKPKGEIASAKDNGRQAINAPTVRAKTVSTKAAATPRATSAQTTQRKRETEKVAAKPPQSKPKSKPTANKPARSAATSQPAPEKPVSSPLPSESTRADPATSGKSSKSAAPADAKRPTASKTATKPKAGEKSADTKKAGTKPRSSVTRSGNAKRLHAGLDWDYCGPRPAKLGPANLPPAPSADEQLFVGADTFDYDQELQLLSLQGDVQMVQGSRQIGADKITYDRGSADLVADGHTYLSTPGARLIADDAQLNLESDKGDLSNVDYRLSGTINARGSADRAELINPDLTKFENIVYTACRPGNDDWSLDAAELELDQATGVGVARNAKLRVSGVPVFYTPYISFPIDSRRKSGVLIPSVGNSDDNGVDVTVPYYWNIAPNMDATFFPRYMSKRGGMLGTEFRYLAPHQSAKLFGEIIPDDSNYPGDGSRWAFQVDHKGRYGTRWSSNVKYNEVSDDEYLEDFGDNLELTSVRNIERRGDLIYSGNGWSLLSRLQDFQTVDTSLPSRLRPYGRLPQLLYTMTPLRVGPDIQLGIGAEYDYFRHSVKTQGHRAALQPYASWPLRKSYGHLTPTLNVYLAAYDLKDQEPDKSDSPSYAVPSFNLDGELVFERTINWFDQASLQTLEPRIFYLYTPFTNQDDIPVFDSSELSFSYYSLFRQNRFTGRDRIGDANQLTLGLTSRTLSMSSGRELLRASIGQIIYFRDRDVQIVGLPEDAGSSSIAGELSARILNDWSGRASFEWDPNKDTDRSQKRALELHYQARDDRLLNLAYRFDLGTSEATRYEDTDLSFRMPVNQQIQLVGRWYYSLLYSETLEAFAGVEYGQCCWRMRLLGHHLKNKPDSTGSNSFMVQVELAGLGSLGQQIDNFLERGIYGYQAD